MEAGQLFVWNFFVEKEQLNKSIGIKLTCYSPTTLPFNILHHPAMIIDLGSRLKRLSKLPPKVQTIKLLPCFPCKRESHCIPFSELICEVSGVKKRSHVTHFLKTVGKSPAAALSPYRSLSWEFCQIEMKKEIFLFCSLPLSAPQVLERDRCDLEIFLYHFLHRKPAAAQSTQGGVTS